MIDWVISFFAACAVVALVVWCTWAVVPLLRSLYVG